MSNRITYALLAAALAGLPARAQAPADTLTLDAVYAQAAARNPMLRAERSRADAVAAIRRSAAPKRQSRCRKIGNLAAPPVGTVLACTHFGNRDGFSHFPDRLQVDCWCRTRRSPRCGARPAATCRSTIPARRQGRPRELDRAAQRGAGRRAAASFRNRR